jgi:hypothetical protein
MKRLVFIAVFLSLLAVVALRSPVAAQFNGCPAGFCSPKATGGGGYTGPGDIQAFTFWCGFRAYSAATAGTKAIRVVRASDSTQTDINTLANGNLDAATLTTFLTATTGNVVICYDKAGTNDLGLSTLGVGPVVTANALNTSYCGTHAHAFASSLLSGSALNLSQPYYFSTIGNQTATANGNTLISINNSGYAGAEMSLNATSKALVYSGTSLLSSGTTTTGVWYALQGLFNGGSSVVSLNGTETTGAAGAQATGANVITTANDYSPPSAGQAADAIICETGVISGTVSPTNRINLNANMRGAYGGF